MILTLTFFTLFAYMLCVALLARSFVRSFGCLVGRSFVRSFALSFLSFLFLHLCVFRMFRAFHRACVLVGVLLCVYEVYICMQTLPYTYSLTCTAEQNPKHNITYHMLWLFIRRTTIHLCMLAELLLLLLLLPLPLLAVVVHW